MDVDRLKGKALGELARAFTFEEQKGLERRG
jgi:hypothetical protein